MSKNVLITPYSDEYLNVYSKGALIGMCIDILMREHSKGERGLIDLIRQLSQKYGVERPFKDADLFNDIAQFSNKEVQTFLEKHVRGGAPIPYTDYLSKMGVGSTNVSVDTFIWDNGYDEMILDYKGFGQYLHLKENMQQHRVVQTFGLEAGDQIMAINGVDANILSNFEQFLKTSIDVKSGDEVSIKVIRGGEQLTKQAILQLPKREMAKWTVKNADNSLRKAWLNLQN